MIPLTFFTELAQACADRPFALLTIKDQERYLAKLKSIISVLVGKLQVRELTNTRGYFIASQMAKSFEGATFDEVQFAEALSHLDVMYGPWTKPDLLQQVHHLHSFAEKFRAQVDEFYFAEKRVCESANGLTVKEIETHDVNIFQTVGSFYVWEYTLTLGQEMEKRGDEEKCKLLKDGLDTSVGNLPGLIPLMKSFRQQLAFKVYDHDRRWQILKIFYDFETILASGDLSAIIKGLQQFHIELLTIAKNAGLKTFKGVFYKPYQEGVSYETIIGGLVNTSRK